jgi:hypothetical protein
VGKIYAGLLMLENYRSYKQSLVKYGDSRPVLFFTKKKSLMISDEKFLLKNRTKRHFSIE